MKGSSCPDGESWTDQETLLLLEGMQQYNENWNEIAEHVGTKSKAQCILHFVRLPVDGTPLENIEFSNSSSSNIRNGDNLKKVLSNSNGNLAGDIDTISLSHTPSYYKSPFSFCFSPRNEVLLMFKICIIIDAGANLQDSDFENKFPFANCGNPVMALVGI